MLKPLLTAAHDKDAAKLNKVYEDAGLWLPVTLAAHPLGTL